jgi:acetyl esterase/lipase
VTSVLIHRGPTIAYGSGPRYVEIEAPTAATPAGPPVGVLLVHGGFWRREKSVDSLRPVSADLARHGLTVGNIEYRAVDEGGTWPYCREDIVAAVRGFGEVTGIPVGRTVLVGHSAGGHLALMAAAAIPGMGGVVALAPVTDLVAAAAEGLGDDAVAGLFGGSSLAPDAGTPGVLQDASPAHRTQRPANQVVVIHGTDDQAVPPTHSQRYVATRSHDGVRLVLIDGARHMHLVKPERPAWPTVRTEILVVAGGLTDD